MTAAAAAVIRCFQKLSTPPRRPAAAAVTAAATAAAASIHACCSSGRQRKTPRAANAGTMAPPPLLLLLPPLLHRRPQAVPVSPAIQPPARHHAHPRILLLMLLAHAPAGVLPTGPLLHPASQRRCRCRCCRYRCIIPSIPRSQPPAQHHEPPPPAADRRLRPRVSRRLLHATTRGPSITMSTGPAMQGWQQQAAKPFRPGPGVWCFRRLPPPQPFAAAAPTDRSARCLGASHSMRARPTHREPKSECKCDPGPRQYASQRPRGQRAGRGRNEREPPAKPPQPQSVRCFPS